MLNLSVAYISINSNNFSKSLELMWKGMLGIFVVMLLIYLVVAILNKTGKKDVSDNITKKEESSGVNPTAQSENTSEDEEIFAAVMAAVCEELQADPDNIQFKEIKEI